MGMAMGERDFWVGMAERERERERERACEFTRK